RRARAPADVRRQAVELRLIAGKTQRDVMAGARESARDVAADPTWPDDRDLHPSLLLGAVRDAINASRARRTAARPARRASHAGAAAPCRAGARRRRWRASRRRSRAAAGAPPGARRAGRALVP